jgi:dinuclear metal center YbgI/SA1388 family protein
MKIKDITDYLETIAPLPLQESYDNCGLIVGNSNDSVKKILVTLDVTEEVIDEAAKEKCQLIVAHHPIIFGGIKKLNGKNFVERVVISAIKKNIAIYAIHTNLDNIISGVNAKIAEKLGVLDIQILQPKKQLLKKLVTFIPIQNFEKVSNAIFNAGAGNIGNYSHAGFGVNGTGTFQGNDFANPAIGKKGVLEKVEEIRFEAIFENYNQSKVIGALLQNHPYEEVAYDIIPLENSYAKVGSGMVGILKKPLSELEFLKSVKRKFNSGAIRHTNFLNQKIEKVAFCGGAGRFLLNDAISSGAQVFVTSDFKYHDFFDAEGKILVADIGHYESEQFTKELLTVVLSKKFPIIAAQISKINTNPVKYL